METQTPRPRKTRDRSTPYPRETLESSLECVKTLYDNLGNTPFNRIHAVEGLGYRTISGASTRKIAAMAHYGFIVKDENSNYIINTDLLSRINNPIEEGDSERKEALIEALSTPGVFKYIIDTYKGKSLPAMLENNLFRSDRYKFNEKSSKRVVSIFKHSAEFAGLLVNGVLKEGFGFNVEEATNFEDSDRLENNIDSNIEISESNDRKKEVLLESTIKDTFLTVDLPSGMKISFPKRFEYNVSIGMFAEGIKMIEKIANKIMAESGTKL